MVVQLKVDVLDVESSASCLYDRLEVYKEHEGTSLWDGSSWFCGTVAPATINTNSSRLHVVFVSDESIAPSGFTAHYHAVLPSEKNCSWDEFSCDQGLCLLPTSVCDGYNNCHDRTDEGNCTTKHKDCGGTLTSMEGRFFSPNYPQPYPHLQLCLWHISVPLGHVIDLHFHNFSLESQEECNYDFVEVYDSAGMGATSIMGRFCNSNMPPVLTSSQHVMTILFVADEGIADSGFFATYRAYNATEKTCGPLSSPAEMASVRRRGWFATDGTTVQTEATNSTAPPSPTRLLSPLVSRLRWRCVWASATTPPPSPTSGWPSQISKEPKRYSKTI
uniref:Membrane frizzled-related protein n=1 Tax=Anolis carolinensis TaxID=28377 RepID=H9G5T8_ANOCA